MLLFFLIQIFDLVALSFNKFRDVISKPASSNKHIEYWIPSRRDILNKTKRSTMLSLYFRKSCSTLCTGVNIYSKITDLFIQISIKIITKTVHINYLIPFLKSKKCYQFDLPQNAAHIYQYYHFILW